MGNISVDSGFPKAYDCTDDAEALFKLGFEVSTLALFSEPDGHNPDNWVSEVHFPPLGLCNLAIRSGTGFAIKITEDVNEPLQEMPAYAMLRAFGDTLRIECGGASAFFWYKYKPYFYTVEEAHIHAGPLYGVEFVKQSLAFGLCHRNLKPARVERFGELCDVDDVHEDLIALLQQTGRFQGGF